MNCNIENEEFIDSYRISVTKPQIFFLMKALHAESGSNLHRLLDADIYQESKRNHSRQMLNT